MEFTLQELNEIYYCLGKTLHADGINFANKDLINQIADKVRNEIERQAKDNDEVNKKQHPKIQLKLYGSHTTYINTYIRLDMIIYMMQTIALIANNNPQFKIQTPTRVGETDKGKYLIYE